VKVRYFKPNEFRDWWDLMDPVLLRCLDLFRHLLNSPVTISPAHGAIGRRLGPNSKSQHNVDRWGMVRAVDVIPTVGGQNLKTRHTAKLAIEIAKRSGFTGIGYYPHWKPMPGLHVDVRRDRTVDDPALWGAIRNGPSQTYVSLDEALDNAPDGAY